MPSLHAIVVFVAAFVASMPVVRGAQAGVLLPPLDGTTVDDALRSSNSNTAASIEFENRSGRAVDIYWIDFDGKRVLFQAGLAPGGQWKVNTFLTHPWLVITSGTGGTMDHDTGARLAGFEALTTKGDMAIIPGSPVQFSQGAYRVGAGVSAPVVISTVPPQHSDEGLKAKVAGTVTLVLVVDTDGIARDIHVMKSLGAGLDEKAVEAVQKWRFQPGVRDGQPVPVRANIEVNFGLQDDK